MTKLSELVLHLKNEIPVEICNQIIDSFNEEDSFQEQSKEIDSRETKKSSSNMFTLRSGTTEFFLSKYYTKVGVTKYSEYIKSFNKFADYCILENYCYSHSYRLIRYNEGESIHNHIDSDFCSIFGSCSLILNEEYTGGEFSFFNGDHNLKTQTGDIVVFPAGLFFTHGVTPVESGTRFSVNSFLCNENYFLVRNLDLSQFRDHYIFG